MSADASRPDLNHTLLQAQLARDSYNKSPCVPLGSRGVEGWHDVSHDREELAPYGLEPKDLQAGGRSRFRARLYKPDDSQEAPAQLVFRGSEPLPVRSHWGANLKQAFGGMSDYYQRAAAIGRKLPAEAHVELVGHSLGGGLASAAALTSGKPATLFNAAGLHSRMRRALSEDGQPLHHGADIREFHVRKEWLTSLQRHTRIPEALGTSVSLERPSSFLKANRLFSHTMGAVIQGLRQAISAGDAAPLVPKVRADSVPPFGYFSKSPEQQAALLDALAGTPPARQEAVVQRLNAEARFVREFAEYRREGLPMPQDTAERRRLSKEMDTQLPPGMPEAEAMQRLDQLLQGVEELQKQFHG